MDTFDKLRLIKLTKNNCQILLDSNDGFIINTIYNGNKGGLTKENIKFSMANYISMKGRTLIVPMIILGLLQIRKFTSSWRNIYGSYLLII